MFGKKKKEDEGLSLARERITFAKMPDEDSYAKELVIKLREGSPLVINFEDINEISANKYLAFLSGAAVAFDGKIVKIKNNVFLFAKKEDFIDGSLKEFINEVAKR